METEIYDTFDKNLYRRGAPYYTGDGTPLTERSTIQESSLGDGYSTGSTEMVTHALQSGTFLTGVRGWLIDAEGNAEFNNGIFRGDFQIGGTLITVNSFADIQAALDEVAAAGGGTVALVPDTYTGTSTLTVPSGVTLDGNGSTIDFNGGAYQILMQGTNAYSTGTLSATYGSSNIVGVGTTWTAAMIGQSILIGDFWLTIASRTDNTHIALSSNFIGTSVAGDTYVIATVITNPSIRNLTILNTTISAIKGRYVNTCLMDGVVVDTADIGLDFVDCGSQFVNNFNAYNCTTAGIKFNNAPFAAFSLMGIFNGGGIDLTRVSNTAISAFSMNGIMGVGFKFTNCYDIGLVNYAFIETTSHGIEFVSGNRDINVGYGYMDTCGGDGIKLTATSDGIQMTQNTIINSTGYGTNVAAASCDNNLIVGNNFRNNTSGNISDSGTGTIIQGNSPSSVNNDISVPDEVYGVGWNGSLEVPTKNAVYDKIETLTSVPKMRVSTFFETQARFTLAVSGGTNTFGAGGLAQSTTSTSGRFASAQILADGPGGLGIDHFAGSPTFSCTFGIAAGVIGGSTTAYYGIGAVTVAGTGHTFTTKHIGFKMVGSALSATQGDGSTENSTSLLTGLAQGDTIELICQVNSTASVDYYTRKNGGALSAATNLTSNLPTGVTTAMMQWSVSNNSTAALMANNVITASYER